MEGDEADGSDPTRIRSLAVSPEDAVNAYAYGRENPGEAVLRVTPPFHGRMRARIHVYRVDDTQVTGAVHVPPEDVIADDALAAYPQLEDEFDDLAEDGVAELADDEAERLRKRHAEAVEDWQERAETAIVETVTLETDDGSHRVDVKRLG
ncbi:hypothetical protein [Halopiger xanaduensis]|uniref:DUF8009 domain-containing protein n=1 Tax=Halopiger xanaduensis (strain DSM 18323 / JCM 14033 / SH-6) TaxID=797210 RepID=F8D9B9_HALXS|nr:hypothetical protein [Halopiger xanaduensis]AEH36855.1 hypothetical protein Halxa_2230 [Halopiger xanaduensis SH-6]